MDCFWADSLQMVQLDSKITEDREVREEGEGNFKRMADAFLALRISKFFEMQLQETTRFWHEGFLLRL